VLDLYKSTIEVTELDLTYKVISSQRSRLTGWVMTWGKIPKGGKSAQVAYKQRSLTNRQCEYSQQVVCAKLTYAIHDNKANNLP
jgi:hypothetical protein